MVTAGGIRGVPGAIGLGEFAGAPIPSPAPTIPTGTEGRRCSVVKRNSKTMSSVASWLMSTCIRSRMLLSNGKAFGP